VGGARAVGLANGANPLPIVVPCHRVIGSDGTLTGFGGGLHIKRSLLALEGAACVVDLFAAEERAAFARHPGVGSRPL
jgi:methylated-DNA-[protein]-cysteine S-methyltransferase